ncbi:MAG: HEPN domain-containing protein [Desulfobacteraceae bacterium]|nr:HEPN domain-containing protein [Desulfobacteraceae bacterium]
MEDNFFQKAEENLKAAQILFDNGLYNACANRAYYSALHAVVVALDAKGFKRDRIDHGAVQADFAQRLIKRKKVYPNKFKSYLSDMQAVRDQADYSAKDVSKRLASAQLTQAKQLTEIIRKDLIK